VAARVEQLYTCVWDFGRLTALLPTLDEVRKRAQAQLALVREQHKRRESPEEYKVARPPPLPWSLCASLAIVASAPSCPPRAWRGGARDAGRGLGLQVWISKALFEEMHSLWRREAPAATPH
jgi:hypothetical protein